MAQSAHLEFRSEAFPLIPGEDEETNPGVFGRSLAEWLLLELQERGLPAEGVILEDFGWCVSVPCPPYRGYIACGLSSESDFDWLVFAFVEGGLISRLVGRDKRSESLARIYNAVKDCLTEASEVHDLREQPA